MNSLSLNPLYNRFRITFPKEFIPAEIYDKWNEIINKFDKNFFREPIDIINESIQSIEFSGISESTIEQEQTYRNPATGRIEPKGKVTYRSSANPIDLMDNSITMTFRHNNGFYNYFLMFESWFYHHAKQNDENKLEHLFIEVLDDEGQVLWTVILKNPIFDSIDSLTLSFNKVERSSETFNCKFKYSNIDFEFGPVKKYITSGKNDFIEG